MDYIIWNAQNNWDVPVSYGAHWPGFRQGSTQMPSALSKKTTLCLPDSGKPRKSQGEITQAGSNPMDKFRYNICILLILKSKQISQQGVQRIQHNSGLARTLSRKRESFPHYKEINGLLNHMNHKLVYSLKAPCITHRSTNRHTPPCYSPDNNSISPWPMGHLD